VRLPVYLHIDGNLLPGNHTAQQVNVVRITRRSIV